MQKLIKNGQIIDDSWSVLPKGEDPSSTHVPEGKVLVPLSVWLAQVDSLSQRDVKGVWIDSDEDVELLAEYVHRFEIIGVNFPSFRDGRGYSTARLLRERYGFKGEIRAIGDVLQDQLFFMKRCGMDAFAVRADRDIQKALEGLTVFSETYQAAVDNQRPLFRRRQQASA